MTDHYSHILERLKSEYESVERFYGRTVYKLTKRGFVYLRYSRRAKTGHERYFFGLEKDAIRKLSNSEFTVIFVCGQGTDNFVINKDLLLSIVDEAKIAGNQWKVNIYPREKKWYLKVSGKKRVEISNFRNRFDLILSRIIFLEREIAKITVQEESEKPDSQLLSDAEQIKSQLMSSSIESKNPKLFEESIVKCFNFLGFECEHIGGSGNTDVLVSKPYRIIVEAKATTRTSLSKIYFTRLKQHKKKHRAHGIVVVANGFEPSVIRDAEIENTTLLKTESLCELIDIHNEYPLQLHDCQRFLSIVGLLREDELIDIRKGVDKRRRKLEALPVIIQSVDTQKRSLDEIFGRYQIKCEEASKTCLDKSDFSALIEFLSLSFTSLLVKEGSLYCRELGDESALKLLGKIGLNIHESCN